MQWMRLSIRHDPELDVITELLDGQGYTCKRKTIKRLTVDQTTQDTHFHYFAVD